MEYTKLGNTDITVSKICVGCMSFGKAGTMHDWTLDETATESVVRHALDLGINFFDTAMSYQGGTSEMFVSEEYLGRALQKNTQRKRSSLPLRSTLIPADCPERRSTERLTARYSVWEQITWISTSSIALTMKHLLRRLWKR